MANANVTLGQFGPVVLATDLDDTIIPLFRTWLPTYVRALSDQRNLPQTPALPRSGDYVRVLDASQLFDQNLPTVAVTSVHTTGKITRQPDRSQGGTIKVAVTGVVRGQNRDNSRTIASIYEGAIRLIMLEQVPGQGPIHEVLHTSWDIQPVPDPSKGGRYLCAAMDMFEVKLDQMTSTAGAPKVPDAEPYVDSALVDADATIVVESE
jgi:hypothetical protein